ncbi:FAD-binding protein [Paenibacillus sp. LMG 31456]|uniref:L-aspartate oxidase n=1 Tax=Paenibacillus foliorum TaxID=2654974 RepID=A0A972GYA2_9BACL|nr:FAD-binding protein [Paenibacillus foliorum]NOU92776.1 FAD-binding protein [Paenibacillus foliorum]
MTNHSKDKERSLEADVLILGGGPAGTWAAVAAAEAGASVILADKGYCGTSGATAPSGNNIWVAHPDPELHEKAMQDRHRLGGFLSDHAYLNPVLAQTVVNRSRLEAWKFPFHYNQAGDTIYSLQGPEYMKMMRSRVKRAGVKIMDHCPATELLADDEGVCGAAGILLDSGERWSVKANAVIIATGGCAFLSKALGCNVLTGDGLLMAVEAGAELSGMEFSNTYGICAANSSVTKNAFFSYGSYTYEDGSLVEGTEAAEDVIVPAKIFTIQSAIAKKLKNHPIYCKFDKASEAQQPQMRKSQPNLFLAFDRLGIDPFRDRFPVTLRLEGTVRGTGGINILDQTCATRVPGLYAAGDAATREHIAGGFSGGGSHNAAWAMSSGVFSGQAAAQFASTLGQHGRKRNFKGLAGTTEAGSGERTYQDVHNTDIIRAVQDEVMPYDKNFFRSEAKLHSSLSNLHEVWKNIRSTSAPTGRQEVKFREATAMAAVSRWMYTSALNRTESRGMHQYEDYPHLDQAQQRRLLSGGLDQVWVKPV